MKRITFTAISVLLGACSNTPTASIGTAAYDPGTFDYTVSQNGVDHTLSASVTRGAKIYNGVSFWIWASGGAAPSGSATGFVAPVDYYLAAGLDGSTYFAGISGPTNFTPPVSGTAALTGAYAFVVNGVDLNGPLTLAANFGSGVVFDTSTGIAVNATISGSSIAGTVDIAGETGTLEGGFFTNAGSPNGYDLVGVALGANMAGFISVH